MSRSVARESFNRAGRRWPVRTIAWGLALLPALWLVWRALTHDLGPRPMTEATHRTGDWAIRLLWLSLAITPLRRVLDWPGLHPARQAFGLAAFAYALGHMALFIVDQKFNWLKIVTEIALRYYLTIGFVAVLGLAALAATSGEAMLRRLGSERWNNIHKIVYLIAFLSVLHFYIQSKLDVAQPLLMTGVFYLLMGHRLLVRQGRTGAPALAGLALVASLATMLTEMVWYRAVNRVPMLDLFLSNFDFEYEIRVMWLVLAVGTVATVAQALFGRAPRARA